MRNFNSYNIQQFESFIDNIRLMRDINHIQIHHTWRPRKTDYKGEQTIHSMWRYHTNTRGWTDIGQHFSVAPDGAIWDGRSLDKNPAGISNNNSGGIMFEIIGNFDHGQEELEGSQLYAITRATALLLDKFGLSHDDIVFHRDHSSKSCPGSGISKEWFIEMVKRSVDNKPSKVSNWAKDAHKWIVTNGISDGSRPQDPITREEVWTMLYRMSDEGGGQT